MDYLKIILIIIAAIAVIVIIALIIAKSSEKNEYLQLKVNYGRLKKTGSRILMTLHGMILTWTRYL